MFTLTYSLTYWLDRFSQLQRLPQLRLCKFLTWNVGPISLSIYWKHSEQEYIPVGCVPFTAVAVGGGGSAQEGCLPRGVFAQEVSAKGVSDQGEGVSDWEDVWPGRGVCPVHARIHTSPLWTEFLTHVFENIIFPQLRCGR